MIRRSVLIREERAQVPFLERRHFRGRKLHINAIRLDPSGVHSPTTEKLAGKFTRSYYRDKQSQEVQCRFFTNAGNATLLGRVLRRIELDSVGDCGARLY